MFLNSFWNILINYPSCNIVFHTITISMSMSMPFENFRLIGNKEMVVRLLQHHPPPAPIIPLFINMCFTNSIYPRLLRPISLPGACQLLHTADSQMAPSLLWLPEIRKLGIQNCTLFIHMWSWNIWVMLLWILLFCFASSLSFPPYLFILSLLFSLHLSFLFNKNRPIILWLG